MKRALTVLLALLSVAAFAPAPARAQTKIRVGWCAKTISAAAAPFAVAIKMGWFKAGGIDVELVPLAGSGDCTKNVASKELPFSLPSCEPLSAARSQGLKAKIFYTAYQGNIYGIAVPANSPIKSIPDLRGKTIGVISMGSAGVQIARSLVAAHGMDPMKDVSIVPAGEGAQTAAMLRNKQVDALSQFDTQYAMVENAGVPVRMLPTADIDRYPSNGFLVLEDTLKTMHKEAVALAKGYAMGTNFAIANPEAAVRMVWEVWPFTKPTGKSEAQALHDTVKVLEARIVNWKLDKAGVKRWGENSEKNYSAYIDFMLKTGVIKQKVSVNDIVTNELIPEINTFDPAKIAAEARAYKAK